MHGAQQILPFLEDETGNPRKMAEEMYSAFQLLAGKKHENETMRAMTRALWPAVFVQGLTSTHVAVDELDFSKLAIEITNPPRQAEIGHYIRNANLDQVEKLDKILDTIRFQDIGAEAPAEEQEMQVKILPGLFTPDVSEGIAKLLPAVQIEDVGKMAVLDSFFTTDQVLDVAEEFRKIHEMIRGNQLRWKSLEDLLLEPYNRWVTDLAVKLKDIQERYDSALTQTNSEIDDSFVEARVKSEKDTADMTIQREKKGLCSEMVSMFRPVANQLDELAASLKNLYVGEKVISRGVQATITAVEDRMEALSAFRPQLDENLEEIKQTYQEFLAKLNDVDSRAQEKVEHTESELHQRLSQKEVSMEEIEAEKLKAIDDVAQIKDTIDAKFAVIKEIIDAKIVACRHEAEVVAQWALPDDQIQVSMPIMRVFMPLYVAIFESGDMEERICVTLPHYTQNLPNGGSITPIHPAFEQFETEVEKIFDDDLKKRSNFEFACETKNMFQQRQLKASILSAANTFGQQYFSKEQQNLALQMIEQVWKE